MSKKRTSSPIADLLRRTIREALDKGETTYLALERETGVTRASIMRFVTEQRSLRLDVADKLATRFGLELREKDT